MPELPEVETIVADLQPGLTGVRILGAEVRHPAIVRHPEPRLFEAGVRGRVIESLTRRGKYILMRLDDSQLLVVHLGMSGQLRLVDPGLPLEPHTHAVFTLSSGRQLRYRDVRRFGRLLLGTEAELLRLRALPRLGPEPLDTAFRPADLYRRLQHRRAPLKALLLDQAVLAGVGNI